MFGAEIARLRKLGVQGVSTAPRCSGQPVQKLTPPAALSGSELSYGRDVWSHDVEGIVSGHQLGIPYRCGPLVGHPKSRESKVIILRGSMEPAFYRGDILFLINPPNTPYEVGDITVYKVSVLCLDLILIC